MSSLHCPALLILSAAVCLFVAVPTAQAQLYFPPINDTSWKTVSFAELGWCNENVDTLYRYLAVNHTHAFIVLKDGMIAMEWYPDSLSKTDKWYWASAGKSLTSVLVGIAKQEGHLKLTDPSSTYLGTGWTSLPPEKEELITVWNQITMTTGLDDGVSDHDCTDSSCLVYKADPGTRWAYHNAPYTLLDGVIQAATGQTINQYLTEKIKLPTGMDGLYIKSDEINLMVSTPRSMARFGLLALNGFNWDGTQILTDSVYAHDMLNTSQELNKSYGYLWWLNGKASMMLPGSQLVFNGPLTPHAPPDTYNGLGKNDQIVSVVPSEHLVVVRMGDNATPTAIDVPTVFLDGMWALLRKVMCNPASTPEDTRTHSEILERGFDTIPPNSNVFVVTTTGQMKHVCTPQEHFDVKMISPVDCLAVRIVRVAHDQQANVYLLVTSLPGN